MISEAIKEDLKRDEGLRLAAYDDATGLKIDPGAHVQGYATIGYGRNLVSRGITAAEAEYLLSNDIDTTDGYLSITYKFYDTLSPNRQRALINMAFCMGMKGLSTFKQMIAAFYAKDYSEAAHQIEDSKFGKGIHAARAKRIASLVREG